MAAWAACSAWAAASAAWALAAAVGEGGGVWPSGGGKGSIGVEVRPGARARAAEGEAGEEPGVLIPRKKMARKNRLIAYGEQGLHIYR